MDPLDQLRRGMRARLVGLDRDVRAERTVEQREIGIDLRPRHGVGRQQRAVAGTSGSKRSTGARGPVSFTPLP